jgi:hypothetical protein
MYKSMAEWVKSTNAIVGLVVKHLDVFFIFLMKVGL